MVVTTLFELEENNNRIFAKLEGENPSGSIKDRLAEYLINSAITSGKLVSGQTILEVSIGNTGVALSRVGKELGYNVEIVLPDNVSEDLVRRIESFGGIINLLPASKGLDYALSFAKERSQSSDYYWTNQYNNKDSTGAYDSLVNELISENLDIHYLVVGVGTGGTIMGVGSGLKNHNDTKVIAVESCMGEFISGLRNSEEYYLGDKDIYNKDFPQEIFRVPKNKLSNYTSLLLKQNIDAGDSSAAVYYAAKQVSDRVSGQNIIMVLADGGLKKNG